MSAKKRAIVRMDRKEYEELKKLEKKHIEDRGSVKWHEAEVASGYVEENIQAMRERQEHYRQMVESLNGEIDQVESQTHQALMNQEMNFLNQINTMEMEMSRNTDELLHQQNDTFHYLIDTVYQNYNDALRQIELRIENLESNQQEKNALAIYLLEDVDQYFNWLCATYDWNFHQPGVLMEFERRIDQAFDNYHHGLVEGSVIQNQEIKADLVRARLELEQKQSEWSLLRGMVDQRILQLEEIINECRMVFPVDLHMNVIEGVDLLDVNYWSEGQLGILEEKLRYLKRMVQDQHCRVTKEELRGWLSEIGEDVDEQLANSIMLARHNALDAQIRRNLAAIAADVMASNGFKVVDYTSDINGIQEPFFVMMQDDHGGEVKIDVTPEQGIANNISINMTESAPVMEYQLENQRLEVIDELHRKGVSVQRLDSLTYALPMTNHYVNEPLIEYNEKISVQKKPKRRRRS